MTDGDLGNARRARADGGSALQRFLDDLAIGTAGDRRLGRRWLHQAAGEDATVVGILTDIAEQQADVTLDVAPDRSVRGRIRGIGRDFVLLVEERGRRLVVTTAITGIRTDAAGLAPPIGDRDVVHDVTVLEVLAATAPERPEVLLHRRTDQQGRGLGGRLLAAGSDVVVLRRGGAAPVDVVLPAHALADVLLDVR